MSPKMDANAGEYSTEVERAVAPRPDSTGAAVLALPPRPPRAPVMNEVVPSGLDTKQSAPPPPTRRRRSALKKSSADPSPTSANKRPKPKPISSGSAKSSSVVVSKGMLFSRAELRSPPLSTSRKVCTASMGRFASSSSTPLASPSLSMSPEASGSRNPTSSIPTSSSYDRLRTSSLPVTTIKDNIVLPAATPTSSTSSSTAPQRNDSFVALRALEAKRRAAWTFVDRMSSSSSSSARPPPALAALGTTTGCYRRRRTSNRGSGSTTAKKTPPPYFPKMSYPIMLGPSTSTSNAPAAGASARPLPAPPAPTTWSSSSPEIAVDTDDTEAKLFPGLLSAQNSRQSKARGKERYVAPLSEPGARGSARLKETLEQKWAAWEEQENEDPAKALGKPAPAPSIPDRSLFASVSGDEGARKGWKGVGDFHDKVALLGDYVASVFERMKRVSVPQRFDDDYKRNSQDVVVGVE